MNSKPHNTQEIDELILNVMGCDLNDSEQVRIYREDYSFDEAKQLILDWHNKQVEALLDRLEAQAGWYSQLLTDKARHDPSVEDTLITLTAIQAERTRLRGDDE